MRFPSRLAWLAAVLLVCGCNRGNDRAETNTAADTSRQRDSAAAPTPIGDPQILHIIRTANNVESELGDMAATRAIDEEVRRYAQTVAADHRALNQIVDSVARTINAIPAENPISLEMRARSDTVRAQLSARAGGDFGRAYIMHEAQFHQALLDRIDRDLMRRTQRPEILQMFERLRPALAAHLQMAQQIQNRFAAPPGAAPLPAEPGAQRPTRPRPQVPPPTTNQTTTRRPEAINCDAMCADVARNFQSTARGARLDRHVDCIPYNPPVALRQHATASSTRTLWSAYGFESQRGRTGIADERTPMNPVDTSQLEMVAVSSPEDASINWTGAFPFYAGHDAANTVVVPFSIAPGGHLGWHTDSLEETQYIIAGHGELEREEGSTTVGPGSVFVLPKDVRHDLRNTGTVPLLAVAFFSGGALTQTFDNVMRPTNTHTLSSPNATG